MSLPSSNEMEVGEGEESVVMLEVQESMKKIQRIPSFLRSKNGNSHDDYDPKVVSLGPYHHGKPELQLLQGFKHKVLQEFISDSNRDVSFYKNMVLEVVDKARGCYVDGSTDEYGDSEFGEMMLLDACFQLFLILGDFGVFKNSSKYLLQQIGYSAYFYINDDTSLLENQIPLWIVELLFNANIYGTTLGISWKRLLLKYCQLDIFGVENEDEVDEEDTLPGEPLHLLEAFHMHMVVCKSHTTQMFLPSSDSAGCCPKIKPTQKNSTIMKLQNDAFEQYGYIFRSVMDLKSKGIHFARSDNIYSVLSIKFEYNHVYAKLKLPIWCATPLSRVFFTNIIAYELCPSNCTQLEVTFYINFMKSLIVCPNDVKELREKRIILNELGDDMEVVQLFKGLNTHGADNPNIFKDVKRKIQEHYDNPKKTWMAEFIYTYLRSPWSVIALLAACVLLVLTFAQTYATFKWHN